MKKEAAQALTTNYLFNKRNTARVRSPSTQCTVGFLHWPPSHSYSSQLGSCYVLCTLHFIPFRSLWPLVPGPVQVQVSNAPLRSPCNHLTHSWAINFQYVKHMLCYARLSNLNRQSNFNELTSWERNQCRRGQAINGVIKQRNCRLPTINVFDLLNQCDKFYYLWCH